MIELDIKIRAKDEDTVKFFVKLMSDSLQIANTLKQIDVTLSAEKNGDTITVIRKEIIKPKLFTPIKDFIYKADFPNRVIHVLKGFPGLGMPAPFEFAEDITKGKLLQCKNAGNRTWTLIEEELEKQNILY